MKRFVFCLFSVISFVAPASTALAEETMENPAYKMWAVWKEGAYATIKGESTFGDTRTVVATTQKLKSITAEKAVIEVTTVTETNGQTIKSPPTTYDILACEPKLSDELRKQLEEQAKLIADKFKQTKGKETLTINGTKLECEWVRTEAENNDSKAWSSNDVPGQTVKMQSAIGPLKSSMQLIDWKGEKK